MAIYHLSVKAVSRSSGRSATAAAAYRAGCEITDERTGVIHDYQRKVGVESADIVLPDGASEWANDRAKLWNVAELAEKRKDACVAREFEVALPSELSPSERRRLALDFAKDMANREGCAVDVAIHAPGKEGDSRNHHAHILRTTRKVEAEGLGAKLDTEKAGRKRSDDLEAVRTRWACMTNERLRENGIDSRVDHRSLAAQGIDREPTQHLGPAASGYERRTGEPSQKRQDFEREAAERLARAKELGELERQSSQIDRSILDLSGDLTAAIQERDQRQTERVLPIDLKKLQAKLLTEPRYQTRLVAADQQEAQGWSLRDEYTHMGGLKRLFGNPDALLKQADDLIDQANEARAKVRCDVERDPELLNARQANQAIEAQQKGKQSRGAGAHKHPQSDLNRRDGADYVQALENITRETLATVPGLLPSGAALSALKTIEKRLNQEFEAVPSSIDLDQVQRKVLAGSRYQARSTAADKMEREGLAIQEKYVQAGSVRRLFTNDNKVFTTSSALLDAAKRERDQICVDAKGDPEMEAARCSNKAHDEARWKLQAQQRELRKIAETYDTHRTLWQRSGSLPLPALVGEVADEARKVVPAVVAVMEKTEAARWLEKAKEVAWVDPDLSTSHSYERASQSRFVQSEEMRKQAEFERKRVAEQGKQQAQERAHRKGRGFSM